MQKTSDSRFLKDAIYGTISDTPRVLRILIRLASSFCRKSGDRISLAELKDASKVLMEWRAKLEKEPSLLQPFQIDEIVREVRQRLC